ncbi:MAG: EAL domain-containing protein [Alphaproteobacteria bacterium]|nr:EAL domain-containing protein [Rhodospirillales bacterium]MCW9045177.1 EAL domain-containing protein [Alphaproteobacteria bacterium]
MADMMSNAVGSNMEPSQEKLLLDQVNRVNRSRMGRLAVHLHLSDLLEYYRKPYHIRVAARSFDSIVNNTESQAYSLANGDLIVMSKDVTPVELQSIVTKVRTLFKNDPLTDDDVPDENFCTWYDLNRQYDNFHILAQNLAAIEAKREQKIKALEMRGKKVASAKEVPLDPKTLDAICNSVERVDITHLVRTQSAIKIGSGGAGKLLFKEFFVSIKDLKARVAPGVDLVGGKWLFQHLTEVLDRRILLSFTKQFLGKLGGSASINLNLSTVMMNEFDIFDEAVGDGQKKIVIEFQNMDVFGNMNLYLEASAKLRERGYKILIDGLNPLSLQTFDPTALDPDFFKVNWGIQHTHGTSPQRFEDMKDMVKHMGHDKVVVAHVESEEAIRFGLTLGVSQFQGFYTDRLISAMANKLGKKTP